MTSIGTAGMTTDINPIASTPRAAGPPPDTIDARLFTEMLENAGSSGRRVELSEAAGMPVLCRVDMTYGGHCDLQAAAGQSEEQQEAALLAEAGPVEPPLFTVVQTTGQATEVAYLAPGRGQPDPADGQAATAGSPLAVMAQPTATNPIGSGDAPGRSIPASGTPQLVPAHLSLPAADMVMGRAGRLISAAGSIQTAAPPSEIPVSSTRHETHLLAAEGAASAIRQLVWAGQSAENGTGSPEAGAERPAIEAVAEVVPSGPAGSEVEPVAVQIAGQVAGAWASLRGALPLDNAESAAPTAAASPPPVTTQDVVKAMRFDLHPGDLGEVHVRLSMNGNELRLHLSFSADRAAGIAQAEGQALMQALSEGGLSLSQLVIDTVPMTRADTQVRQDGPASHVALSGGSMTDGSGAGRERHAEQEPARRHPLRERSSAEPGVRIQTKAGIFI